MNSADRRRLHDEAIAVLDSLHDRFLFDKGSDGRIADIESADARLRIIVALLAGCEPT